MPWPLSVTELRVPLGLPASSVPDQLTVKVGALVAGNGATLLVGGPASMVLRSCLAGSIPLLGSWSSAWSVAIGGLTSNVTRATLRICVPVVRLFFGSMM